VVAVGYGKTRRDSVLPMPRKGDIIVDRQLQMPMPTQKDITTVCIVKPHLSLFSVILKTAVFNKLLNKLSASDIDIVILS